MTPEQQQALRAQLFAEASTSPQAAFALLENMLTATRKALAVAVARAGGSMTFTNDELVAVDQDGFGASYSEDGETLTLSYRPISQN